METQHASQIARHACLQAASSCLVAPALALPVGWVGVGNETAASSSGWHMAVPDIDGLARSGNGVWGMSGLWWVVVDPCMGGSMDD